MTELDDLRKQVKEKKRIEAEESEKQELKEELEKGTVRGLIKKGGKSLFNKLIK